MNYSQLKNLCYTKKLCATFRNEASANRALKYLGDNFSYDGLRYSISDNIITCEGMDSLFFGLTFLLKLEELGAVDFN